MSSRQLNRRLARSAVHATSHVSGSSRFLCVFGTCQQQRHPGRALALVCVLLAAVAGACGGTAALSAPSTSTTTPAATTSPPTTSPPTTTQPTISTTTSPTVATVLKAYRAGWAAFEKASATSNAFDPSLPATMADPLLQQVRQNLVGDQAAGVVARGGIKLHPRVLAVTGATAVVIDCSVSSSELVYATTGKPVPPVTPPEHDGDRATLVLSGSTWKVSAESITEGECPSGY
jgi:hypothetical protein